MSERKYKLRHTISTPFGTWAAGEVRTEHEWRDIAPNGGSLVEFLDLQDSFEPVIDGLWEVWVKADGMPVLLMLDHVYGDRVGQSWIAQEDARTMADAYTAYAEAYEKHITKTQSA